MLEILLPIFMVCSAGWQWYTRVSNCLQIDFFEWTARYPPRGQMPLLIFEHSDCEAGTSLFGWNTLGLLNLHKYLKTMKTQMGPLSCDYDRECKWIIWFLFKLLLSESYGCHKTLPQWLKLHLIRLRTLLGYVNHTWYWKPRKFNWNPHYVWKRLQMNWVMYKSIDVEIGDCISSCNYG